MAAETELMELFERARKAADRVASSSLDGAALDSEEARCVDALRALHTIPVTTSMLVSTQVGKRLRNLKKHSCPGIQSAASDLLDVWKRAVAAEVKVSHSSAVTGEETPKGEKRAEKPLPPAAVKTDVKSRNGSMVGLAGGKLSSALAGKAAAEKAERTEAAKRQAKPKLSSIPKTDDETRDKIRELLVEAFDRVRGEAEGDEETSRAMASDPVRTAVSVETVMFKELGLSKGVNKVKYRSIMFNLKDSNNPDLRRKVLLGDISPERLVSMTSEEMASDKRKRENRDIKEKALFECERGQAQQASTDQFRCGKCGQRKCTYFQLQTRSADEPMTTFVSCVNCNNRWKFC